MKLILVIFAIILVSVSARDPRCPVLGEDDEATHVEHETDCTKFYKCDSEGNLVEMDCYPGTEYYPELGVCGWPTGKCKVVLSLRKVANKNDELPKGCDPNEDPETQDPTLLPHPTKCEDFYKCYLGTPILQHCPSGLHWNIEKNYCDYPLEAKCVRPLPFTFVRSALQKDDELPEGCDPNEDPTNPTHLPHPTRCDCFYKCYKGTPVLIECPPNQHWNIEKNYCDWISEAHCVRPLPFTFVRAALKKDDELPKGCDPNEDPETQDPTLLPHPTKCEDFYKCYLGTPILQHCPSGLHWNIEKNYCDYPLDAKCVRPLPFTFVRAAIQKDDELPEGCDPNEDPTNPTHLPHPTRCDCFYKCYKGTPVLINCPPNQHWNIEKNYCDWISEAHCVRPLPFFY